jgi:1-acyl-sn-glycerol-3-phosphate acyltransferase
MAMNNEEAHALSRKRGTSRFIYGSARVLLTPIAATWYRFKVTGAEYVPKEGAAIIAPNHKSFYDSFFVGLATKRHLHFMAKTELFEGKSAPLLSGLGAFPVRRGTADPDALETARLHLEAGRVLALFPEGTRYRDPEQLRSPHKGAGRLAIEAQCPIVPCAITGTDRLFRGWFPRPVKVQVSFAPAIQPAQLEATPEAAADLIENQVWPEVEREFARLKANPGLVAAVLAALSAGAAGGGFAYKNQKKPKRRIPSIPKPKLKLGRKKKGPFRR